MSNHIRGTQQKSSKLTDQQVRDIYTSPERQSILARQYGVSPTAIHRIVKGKGWTHITADLKPVRLHFVGFRGNEFISAIKVFGQPDFIHHDADRRFWVGGELGKADVVIFANGHEAKCSVFTRDDSAHF